MALGRFRGTEVRVHWSWIPVLALILVGFGGGLESGDGAWPAAVAWATAIVVAVAVFVSVTVHELAHVYVASRFGLRSPAVVVQLLGGPYVMSVHPREAREELAVAAAGPVVSLVLAGLLLGVGALAWAAGAGDASASVGLQASGLIVIWTGFVNVALAVVNIVPGYPLDGARMLHAVAWMRTGTEFAATQRTVRVGRYVGYVLMGIGVYMTLFDDPLLGLGLVVAGWLIITSSRVLDQRAFLQSLLMGVHVGDALDRNPVRVPPQLTLDVFAGDYVGAQLGAAALVERGADLLGIVGTAQIRRIPRRSWAETRTEQAMVPLVSVPTSTEDAELWPALEMLEQSGLDALVVPQPEGDPALLTRRSAAMFVQEKALEERRQRSARGSRPGGRGLFGR